ncbi:MAG: PEGA domain-containing protein [Proteobacteria bacterium]|nr:PEGA domain-containing protein [Pseudomonadota bacterium]
MNDRSRVWRLALVTLAACVVAGPAARAQPKQDVQPGATDPPHVTSAAQALQRARVHLQQGEYEPALATVDAGLALEAKHLPLLRLRATVLLEKLDYEGALAAYEAFLAAGPRGANRRKARKIVANLQIARTTFLTVRVENGPANVYLNRKQYGVWCRAAPECTRGIVPRGFRVHVERDGFVTEIERVTISAAKTHELVVTLKEKPSRLDIAVTPNNARVSVDDDELGIGDQSVEVPPGNHTVRVALDGFVTHEKAISAHLGKTVAVAVKLAPVAPTTDRRDARPRVAGAKAHPCPPETPDLPEGGADGQKPVPSAGTTKRKSDRRERPGRLFERRDDAAWALYHCAYSAAARRQPDRARSLLRELVDKHAEHPAARLAAEFVAPVEAAAPDPTSSEMATPTGLGAIPLTPPGQTDSSAGAHSEVAEKPSRASRSELAIFQTLHGIATGIELCLAVQCESGVAVSILTLTGGSVGLSLSLVKSEGTLTPGQRALLNSGTLWGAYNGVLASRMAGFESQGTAVLLLLGQATGLGAAGVLSRWRPTDGQVALANTFGIWSGVIAFLGMGALNIDRDAEDAYTALLLATDLGVLYGAVVAERHRHSRGYTFLIDAGGLVGALSGYGTAVLISGDPDAQFSASAALAGAIVGLGSAAYLARKWDRPSPPLRLTLLPTAGGVTAGLAFDLDL